MVTAQGGNASVTEDFSLFPTAKYSYEVLADKDGYVERVDTEL